MAYNSNIIIPIHYWLFDIGVTNATTNDASTLNAIQVANNEPQKLRYASTYSRIYILSYTVFCISFAKYFLFCVIEWVSECVGFFFAFSHSLKFHP